MEIRLLLLKVLGVLCVLLGGGGIFVPILPTTPFLLAALYCFSKSSPALKNRLLSNRVLGPYVRCYADGKTAVMPLWVKVRTLALLWGVMLISAVFFVELLWVRIMLIVIAIAISVHLALIRSK